MNTDYDAIIIGAGQGGVPLAHEFAGRGKRTLLVESKHIGGTCINEGCTPTKTMVASARVAYLARRAGDFGVSTGEVSVDLGKVRARKRDIVESFRTSSLTRAKDTENLTYLEGEARFEDRKRITVARDDGGTETFTADLIFINTGGRPRSLPVSGLEEAGYLTSTTIMELGEVPEHLVILGGSYIGGEFGQMFRRFGSRVTVIEVGDRLFSKEDPDVSDAVLGIFQEDGIDVLLEASAKQVTRSGDAVEIEVDVAGETRTVSGSHLLVAIGRTPNTEDLNLEAAGVETLRHGYVKTNDRLETSVPGIYAIGDVKGGPMFTHISYDDYRIVRDNLFGDGGASIENRMVPFTVFIDPQLGRVGLTETAAREAGREYDLYKMDMSYSARALETDEPRGFMKALVDPTTDQIIGCAILAPEGGELMSALQIAMMAGLPYTELHEGVFTHPTFAESFNTLFAMKQ